MSSGTALEKADAIRGLIHVIRGQNVMLDSDLADLYGVETGALIRAMKRNGERFPEDFAFQLTSDEWENLRCQIGISSGAHGGGSERPPTSASTSSSTRCGSCLPGHSPGGGRSALQPTSSRVGRTTGSLWGTMELAYDNEADALAIKLGDGIVGHTVEVDSGTLVDLDREGRVLSIEVIQPARRWPLDKVLDRFPIEPADAAMLRGI